MFEPETLLNDSSEFNSGNSVTRFTLQLPIQEKIRNITSFTLLSACTAYFVANLLLLDAPQNLKLFRFNICIFINIDISGIDSEQEEFLKKPKQVKKLTDSDIYSVRGEDAERMLLLPKQYIEETKDKKGKKKTKERTYYIPSKIYRTHHEYMRAIGKEL